MTERATSIVSGSEGQPGPSRDFVSNGGSAIEGVATGIRPLDEGVGGLKTGGIYLFAGPPGPEKLVAILQFLHRGIREGERCLLISGIGADGTLEFAQAWGLPLDQAWREGRLKVLGFRDDFELSVVQSAENTGVMKELDRLASSQIRRIAVDPGSMFLHGGARTLLGQAFIQWAQNHPATLCATLSVESGVSFSPRAEWLLEASDGLFLLDRRSDGLISLRVNQMASGSLRDQDVLTVKLISGLGLTAPEDGWERGKSDRMTGDPNKLLLVRLDRSVGEGMEGWASGGFDADVVTGAEPGISRLENGHYYGSVVIQASRRTVHQVPSLCRAMRPMTGGAVVVAFQEPMRSTDRIGIIEAGADDCISGGVDFRELGARIRKAVAGGGKAPAPASVLQGQPSHLLAGAVPWDSFTRQLVERSGDQEVAAFSLLRIPASAGRGDGVIQLLESNIRLKGGDLVSRGNQECFVLLQGAPRDGARAFLARVEHGLQEAMDSRSIPPIRILVHPRHRRRIRRIARTDLGLSE